MDLKAEAKEIINQFERDHPELITYKGASEKDNSIVISRIKTYVTNEYSKRLDRLKGQKEDGSCCYLKQRLLEKYKWQGGSIELFRDAFIPEIVSKELDKYNSEEYGSQEKRDRFYNDPVFFEKSPSEIAEWLSQVLALDNFLSQLYDGSHDEEFGLTVDDAKVESTVVNEENDHSQSRPQGSKPRSSDKRSKIDASNLTREQLALLFIYLVADGVEDAWPDRGKGKRLEELLIKYSSGNQRSIKKLSKTIFNKKNPNDFHLADIKAVVEFLARASGIDQKYRLSHKNLMEEYNRLLSQEW